MEGKKKNALKLIDMPYLPVTLSHEGTLAGWLQSFTHNS